MWKEQAQKIFLATKNTSTNTQKKTKDALYSIGKEGDFTRVDNTKLDLLLEAILDDEDLTESVGDILDFVEKKLTRYQQYKTKRQTKKSPNKSTRKSRRND
jgi:DNA-binding ferritin-like protein (Dps family)